MTHVFHCWPTAYKIVTAEDGTGKLFYWHWSQCWVYLRETTPLDVWMLKRPGLTEGEVSLMDTISEAHS